MPSKIKPLAPAELEAYEAQRDLAAELLQSVREMKAGQVRVVSSPVIEARKKTGLSQSQFAALMGVSVRTLQGWEQGRKQPSGAARTLLSIASTNPKALLAVAGK
ncbi:MULTISPECIES: DNA-binding transcriptional regulator [unclassified Methyloversatilis]|uniref:helix-turn-helix domain-containing protein n=1 Tax=unclassified Methyloversatilis TaxID=2639971 RepID=UPI00211C4754|nr:helix-turn-helix domain-containing protein [Methyloversatilis sp.]MCQ9372866.1 helix-turn-helix domain-containing protein [Methyloversatilis sp. XJ19-13]MCQ9377663.1 helix-turn-helix domain-containing protein [Methyloversatilis sp. XJ19-49]MDP3873770.1 helix-turn-helix domain-containing protein [Methyloversatilis sp.]